MAHATPEQLALCPGLGEVKVRRLYDAFNLPFKVGAGGKRVRKVKPAEASTSGKSRTSSKTTSGKNSRAGSSVRSEEQLTLSDVGLSMGLGPGILDGDGAQRKRKRDEVVVVDDDDEPTAAEGSPDWPEIASDEEGGGEAKKVWKDPLALSDDSD
jgi:hypothetical protein